MLCVKILPKIVPMLNVNYLRKKAPKLSFKLLLKRPPYYENFLPKKAPYIKRYLIAQMPPYYDSLNYAKNTLRCKKLLNFFKNFPNEHVILFSSGRKKCNFNMVFPKIFSEHLKNIMCHNYYKIHVRMH